MPPKMGYLLKHLVSDLEGYFHEMPVKMKCYPKISVYRSLGMFHETIHLGV